MCVDVYKRQVQYNSDYNPFKVSTGGGGGGAYSRSKVDWEDLYGGLTKASKMNNPQPEPEMDWEDSSMGGESAVMEERTETVMSAASSTLYALSLIHIWRPYEPLLHLILK